jgi:DNA-binding NarL/FixJ family response regulator
VLPDLIESIVALDRADDAKPLIGRLDAAAAGGHRWAAPAAQRARALLCLARRDTEEAAALAAAAAQGFATTGMQFDHARALLVAGNALRRAGQRRQAAEPLTEAARIFAQLPAPLWLEQADRELRRASPRPGRDRDELTAAEARVAALVAAGRKNKEIAAELYTTVGTVEAHLTRIYRKLGIRSRAELARRVAERGLDIEPQL